MSSTLPQENAVYAAPLPADADAEAFRAMARRCIAAGLPPERVSFCDAAQQTLLPLVPECPPAVAVQVPRAYAELMETAILHSAADRFDLLYNMLWRIVNGQRRLTTHAADPVVAEVNRYKRGVRRDIHKMHAFLRFRAEQADGETLYTAWFEPQHYILKRAVPFFVDRFANMDWLIATPLGTALWRGGQLSFGPPGPKPAQPRDRVLDDLWLTYYRTTFNPACLRLKAMTAEMPKHYWRNMPETDQIPAMVQAAEHRVESMRSSGPDRPPAFASRVSGRARRQDPHDPTPLSALRHQAATCTRCPLHGPATQTVFGEGPEQAKVVFVGEQPGDLEDLKGRPFVGPAGQLLDEALGAAGIERHETYLTNAVKHFKYEPRGKRRLHKRPDPGEVSMCRWWLEQELATVKPKLVVALGATAALALSGRRLSVIKQRGPMQFGRHAGFLTVHPSYLLRLPGEEEKRRAFSDFVNDLTAIRALLESAG